MQAVGDFNVKFSRPYGILPEMACYVLSGKTKYTQVSISLIKCGFTSTTVQTFTTPLYCFFRVTRVEGGLYVAGLILALSSHTSSCATGA